MHIDQTIEKIKSRRSKPKPIKNNKAIPIFLYPCEAVIYQKSDTVNLKKNVLAGSSEQAKYEMEQLLGKNNIIDFEISVSMPQGHPVNLIAQDAGRSIHGSFDPFIKNEKRKAERQKQLDLKIAARQTKIDRSLDGLDQIEVNKKLQAAHSAANYKV